MKNKAPDNDFNRLQFGPSSTFEIGPQTGMNRRAVKIYHSCISGEPCEFCKTAHNEVRCPSCGAPRIRTVKPL